MQIYKKLSDDHIRVLTSLNCRAEDWDKVRVAEGFDPEKVRNCFFRGNICLGSGVYINNIGSCISNYTICDGAYIENVATMETVGASTFGNGVQAAAVNEGGGREIPLVDGLTAQAAYIIAMYRHRPAIIKRLKAMAEEYAESVKSEMGTIGAGTRITNSGIIRNVRTGPGTVIEGATILSNGSINCTSENPSFVGAGVKMYDFIVQGRSEIDGGTTLRRCFVGEGVQVCGLTGIDSVFFANSHFENGEVCSIFAGPFTVSHHKSSLLIAGMFSFFNAGSGSNQSNHLFKTGAVHQGINRRGCKYGSDAYVVLPARTGAYTIVLGRHKDHHDTEDFPYSYLIETSGRSCLKPAINLTNYGTVRDLAKWCRRDRRGTLRADRINFQEHNPFITERILRGISASEKLLAGGDKAEYAWSGTKVRSFALRRGLGWYRLAREKFLGAMLAEAPDCPAVPEREWSGAWIDAAGMYMTAAAMDDIFDKIEAGEINSFDGLETELDHIFVRYGAAAYAWALNELEKELGRKASQKDIARAVKRGLRAAAKLEKLTEEDRRKDEGPEMSVGYGLDSQSEEERLEDYRRVRGL